MKTFILDNNLYSRDPEAFARLNDLGFSALNGLSHFYPGFDSWYRSKVQPGLQAGTRKMLLRYSGNELAGIAIVKITQGEKKLCCLRVMSNFKGSGIGVRLFASAIEAVETERPLLSIAEEQKAQFIRIFDYFGFEQTEIYHELYRRSKYELSFNGLIDTSPIV